MRHSLNEHFSGVISMSKDAVVAPITPAAPRPVGLGALLPRPVIAICVLLIIAGGILLLSRPGWVKSSTYDAMQNCDATTYKPYRDRTQTTIDDGLDEQYGLIHVKS